MSSDTYYCERCEEPVTKGAHTCSAAKGWLIKQNKSLTDERDEQKILIQRLESKADELLEALEWALQFPPRDNVWALYKKTLDLIKNEKGQGRGIPNA